MRRNTAAKQRILELLKRGKALSQDMIEEQMAGQADRVTIYRVLNRFCEDGIVHRVVSDEGKAYYALCTGCTEKKHKHEHAHFRCLNCQTVECLPMPVRVNLPRGYSVQNFNYWISGHCGRCR